jgi:sulfite reductase (NADPH) hemoprotein beta-component
MYRYDQHDQTLVDERARQFAGQVARRVEGSLKEDEFKPLRLQNGLYMQMHAYMLRIAVPYGVLSSSQMRKLAHIARTYDRGYGHFTTRQNIQFNWPTLEGVTQALEELSEVEMHAIQTSGNCIRNTTTDEFAGVTRDEIEDPRPYAEIIRQWSTLHPEFAFLPRKFKIAVSATPEAERAAVYFHDIGVKIVREGGDGEVGFQILAGGGLGRTPYVGLKVREFLQKPHLLSYLEAILRVYNRYGRRDDKYKARIKILVNAVGIERFRELVEAEWALIKDTGLLLPDEEVRRVAQYFAPPKYEAVSENDDDFAALRDSEDEAFASWMRNNAVLHKQPGYASVTISLKEPGVPPGDATDVQMDAIADLADRYGFGEIRVSHKQNLVLPDVKIRDLRALYDDLAAHGLATSNARKITDMITCPGLDYCNLASARSIPIALQIMQRFDRIDYVNDLGDVNLNISGCVNACGHHHVGNLGLLGVDRNGEEFYQLTLGGSSGPTSSIGQIIGKSFSKDEIVDAVAKVLETYLAERSSDEETFLETYRRVGQKPFKEALYGSH